MCVWGVAVSSDGNLSRPSRIRFSCEAPPSSITTKQYHTINLASWLKSSTQNFKLYHLNIPAILITLSPPTVKKNWHFKLTVPGQSYSACRVSFRGGGRGHLPPLERPTIHIHNNMTLCSFPLSMTKATCLNWMFYSLLIHKLSTSSRSAQEMTISLPHSPLDV